MVTAVRASQGAAASAPALPQPREGRAPYAADPRCSRGRLVPEPLCPTRSPFQRDRDRIIHSTAFRRLTHKTQVFLYHEGDHYRTRLTHSLEVAQIARTMARQLGLEEDLAEALALAHDLGHPPFGHAGERALQQVAAEYGGFDHNAQSLRVVTAIERKYAAFDGLNLSWETLEGLVKHNGPLTGPRAGNGRGPVPADILVYNDRHDLRLDAFASGEAQIAALADDIAYNNHDLDDGMRAGLITPEMLEDVPLTARFLHEVRVLYGDLSGARLVYEINRRLITAMVADVVGETGRRIAALSPTSAEDIRSAAEPVAAFSSGMLAEIEELRTFLFASVYRHERVMARMRDAQAIVADLFGRYLADPATLPDHWRKAAIGLDDHARARHIVDFVAGMTDRYAITEHQRLFDDTPDLG